MKKYNESELNCFDGSIVILALLFSGILSIFFMNPIFITLLICTCAIVLNGFFIVYPNEAVVISFFGKYTGTHLKEGLFWINPLNKKQKISTNNHSSTLSLECLDKLEKQYNLDINFNWKVVHAAKALFEVENYHAYILKYVPVIMQKVLQNYNLKFSKDVTMRLQYCDIEKLMKEDLNNHLKTIGLEINEINLINIQLVNENQNIEDYKKILISDTLDILEELLLEIQDRDIINLNEIDKTTFITNLITALLNNKNKN